MRDRMKEREKDPVRYTLHNIVVQTPWARRTAFQGGSMDVAHDGVRGGRREEEEEEEDEEGEEKTERSVSKVEERKREREKGREREREGALGNNSIKRRTPSN